MKVTLIFSSIVAATLASVQINIQYPEEWHLWKNEHTKKYDTEREELDRHLVWLANREYINTHNENAHAFGFTLAMNHFGDMVSIYTLCMYKLQHMHTHTHTISGYIYTYACMCLHAYHNVIIIQTDKEYEEMYMTYREIDHGNYTKVFDRSQYSADLPESVDWRTSNAVTDIKYQARVITLKSMCFCTLTYTRF